MVLCSESVKDALRKQLRAEQTNDDSDEPDGSETSSSSEEEDDEGVLLSSAVEADIQRTIDAIRKRDPRIYDASSRFYHDDDDEEGDGNAEPSQSANKKAGGRSVKQVLTEQLLQGDESLSDDDRDVGNAAPAEQQLAARRAFLEADTHDDVDNDEGFEMSVPTETNDMTDPSYAAFVEAKQKEAASRPVPESQTLSRLAGDDGKLSAEDLFLKEYIAGEWWKSERPAGWNKDQARMIRPGSRPATAAIDDNVSEDDAFLEAQDSFEAAYNFRFEEPGGTRLVTHPRVIEDSVRRVDDKRARRREARKRARQARKQAQVEAVKTEKNAWKEEMKALSALKRQELEQKRSVVAQVASGLDKDRLAEIDLEGDFDPDKFDQQMQELFDENWYGQDDGDIKATLKQGKNKKQKADASDDQEPSNGKTSTAALLDELYAMDFEDCLADGLRARFHYTSVPASSYGMTVEEILNAEDKDLNRKISIKQLTPYRTDRNLTSSWQDIQRDRNARHRRRQKRLSKQRPQSSE